MCGVKIMKVVVKAKEPTCDIGKSLPQQTLHSASRETISGIARALSWDSIWDHSPRCGKVLLM
jgi:hypothetical protein